MRHSVLITGAAGFVGRYVSKEFSNQGYDVVGMGWGKFPEYADWGLSVWHEAEVSFEMLCEYAGTPDVIVHCAGGASVGNSVEHPRQDFCLTVDATSHLLEYIRLHSPHTRLIYPSSAAVYGQTKVVPISESSDLNPVSPYGVHKLIAEQLCQMYARRYGLSIAVIRFFSIYGEGLRKELLWDACNKMENNDTDFFGSGDEMRDWLNVRDAASLLIMSVEHASSDCPVVNCGSGTGITVRDVLMGLFLAFGRHDKPRFSGAIRSGDPLKYIADIACVKEWGWNPKISWCSGVREYVRWYEKNRP